MSDQSLRARLIAKGLSPTAKRLQLAHVLFAGGDKHFSADEAHAMVLSSGMKMSQATIYNTLNQFAAAGLLNRIALDGKRSFFDTNTSDHHHLFYEEDGRLVDLAADQLRLSGLPPMPAGEEIRRVDVIVRVARRPA